MDIIGLETMYHVAAHWGEVRGDLQLKTNAEYLKAHFLDKKNLGVKTGEGFYKYPSPAYLAADLLL